MTHYRYRSLDDDWRDCSTWTPELPPVVRERRLGIVRIARQLYDVALARWGGMPWPAGTTEDAVSTDRYFDSDDVCYRLAHADFDPVPESQPIPDYSFAVEAPTAPGAKPYCHSWQRVS